MPSPTRALLLAIALAALLACASAGSSHRGGGRKEDKDKFFPKFPKFRPPPPLRCSPSVCGGVARVGIPN